ncbi:hypothetical protein HanIR_Chr17g0848251 [Helianthus annuus]|nr:hypothetical protein HanIR_Chr17g0848251 [Helianthus annuus]
MVREKKLVGLLVRTVVVDFSWVCWWGCWVCLLRLVNWVCLCLSVDDVSRPRARVSEVGRVTTVKASLKIWNHGILGLDHVLGRRWSLVFEGYNKCYSNAHNLAHSQRGTVG